MKRQNEKRGWVQDNGIKLMMRCSELDTHKGGGGWKTKGRAGGGKYRGLTLHPPLPLFLRLTL